MFRLYSNTDLASPCNEALPEATAISVPVSDLSLKYRPQKATITKKTAIEETSKQGIAKNREEDLKRGREHSYYTKWPKV